MGAGQPPGQYTPLGGSGEQGAEPAAGGSALAAQRRSPVHSERSARCGSSDSERPVVGVTMLSRAAYRLDAWTARRSGNTAPASRAKGAGRGGLGGDGAVLPPRSFLSFGAQQLQGWVRAGSRVLSGPRCGGDAAGGPA